MCPLCCKTTQDYLAFEGFSPMSMPDPFKTHAMFSHACDVCEIQTPVFNWRQFLEMRASLLPDATRDGARGRALVKDMPALGLLRKDRLEPTGELNDVYSIDSLVQAAYTPRRFLFWRRSCETHMRHRSPLFDDRIGLTFENCLAMDFLHNLSKGIFQTFCAYFFAAFFEADVLRTRIGNWEARVNSSVQSVRAMLFAWYRTERGAGRIRTQVQNLVPSMFGTKTSPTLDLHASETNHILPFVKMLLSRYAEIPNHGLWMRGIDSLLVMLDVYQTHGYVNPPLSSIQRFCDSVVVHFRTCRLLSVPGRHKNHFVMEGRAHAFAWVVVVERDLPG